MGLFLGCLFTAVVSIAASVVISMLVTIDIVESRFRDGTYLDYGIQDVWSR